MAPARGIRAPPGTCSSFMTIFQERMLPDVSIEPATVRIPGGHASDRATAPGPIYMVSSPVGQRPSAYQADTHPTELPRLIPFHGVIPCWSSIVNRPDNFRMLITLIE